MTDRPAPGRRGSRIPELDGLRVLMIAIVSWFHIWQQSWIYPDPGLSPAVRNWFANNLHIDTSLYWLVGTGYVWVDGTVLLSVFLLYLPWAKAKRTGAPMPSAGEFYYRRARRIIPSYYFVILCAVLLIALPWKQYETNFPYVRYYFSNLYPRDDLRPWLVKDLATHLTFTFTQFTETMPPYSPLPGAAWTLAMLAQGYLLFPLMARGMRKHPVPVLGGMLLVCFAYRAWCLWTMQSYTMVVNQLVNFLDVYVIGVLCATGFDAVRAARERRRRQSRSRRRMRYLRQAGMTLLFFAALYGLIRMLEVQIRANEQQLQAWQMMYRPVFALCFAGMIFTAPFALWPLRKLLGNRITRFLAGISMNYYLIHQTVAVHLKYRLMVPWSEHFLSEDFLVDGYYPNQVWDEKWMDQYAWLCFAVAFVMAVAVTYLIEKPCAKLFDRIRKKLAGQRAPKT